MNTEHKFVLDLYHFGDGGSGGTGVGSGNAAPSGMNDGNGNGTQEGVQVQYGIQTDAPRTRADAFKQLQTEYKAEFDAWAQDTIQKRLKSSKETVDRYNALSPTLEMLGKKYGVDPSDAEALNKAIQEDDSYYEDEAIEKGVTVEQLKQIKKMERENAQLREQMKQRQAQKQAEQDVAKWLEQEKQAKQVFPNLNLRNEMQNPQFLNLLKSGVDVQTAYYAVHNKELVPQAMQYASLQATQKTLNSINSNRSRPVENGMSGGASAVVKNDVSQLTNADMDEIVRQVRNGKRISFG